MYIMILRFLFFVWTFCKALSTEKYRHFINIFIYLFVIIIIAVIIIIIIIITIIIILVIKQIGQPRPVTITHYYYYHVRAQNNGRSTDNVRPDRGLDRSNSHLAGHFDRSFLDANLLKYFPYSCRFNAFCSITL